MFRRGLLVPVLALTLVGCASGATHESASLNLPERGIAVEVASHRVLLYSLSGHRIGSVTASIANDGVSLHPWLVDRSGRELALRGGTVAFGDVTGKAPMGNRRTTMPAPPGMAGQGHWEMGAPSPSGRWVLEQWSGECEVPIAYLIDTENGQMTTIGTATSGLPPESFALGWQSDSRAVVHFPHGACGSSASKPGVYTVSTDGAIMDLIVPTRRGSRAFMWGG